MDNMAIKNKHKIGGFRTRVYSVCGNDELRPAMQYAYIRDGYLLATNGYVLIRQSLKDFHGIAEEEAENLEGKWLSVRLLKVLEKCEYVRFDKEQIFFINEGINGSFFYEKGEDVAFPSVEGILNRWNPGTESDVVINPKLLDKINESLGFPAEGLALFFSEEYNKGIKVVISGGKESECVALIQPIQKSEETKILKR